MYTTKISQKVNSEEWNKSLLKSKYSTFFQTAEYLNSNSNERFPLFIEISDQNNEVKGQLGITILKKRDGSTKIFRKTSELSSQLGNRGFWVSGPIIHTNKKDVKLLVLEKILDALDVIINENNLIILDGYSPPQDFLIDEEYISIFEKNNFNVQNFLTLFTDLQKTDLDSIWKNVKKNARNDVTKAKRENIEIGEITKKEELEKYKILAKKWAKTKGIDPKKNNEENISKDWNYIKSGIQKIFVAKKDNEMLAGLRIGCYNNIAYTHQVLNAYSEAGNTAGPLLTWHAIEWAKKSNFWIYDFSGGEAPPMNKKNEKRYSEQWNSLFAYKRKWGGQEHSYYHFVKIQNKTKYKLSRILSKPDWILRNYKRKHFKKHSEKQ